MKNFFIITLFIVGFLIFPKITNAYYDCSQYGIWAYSDGLGYCKCMSGYTFDTDIFGNTTCVSIDSQCKDQYGIMSRYDSLTGKCKCVSGYLFGTDSIGRTQCISDDSYCRDKLGYNSRYNTLTDSCECSYGYELSYKTFGSGYECKSCSSKYGYHSEYNALTKKCECKDGYTLENGKCEEKNNSAYFLLKELNTDNNEAIIKSNYNGTCYYIKYGLGCYSWTIDNYLNNNIVINMGTDFYVDIWDILVLQDDDQNCNLTKIKTISCDSSLDNSDSNNYTYISNTNSVCGSNSHSISNNQCQCDAGYEWVDYNNKSNLDCKIIATNINSTPTTTSDTFTDNFVESERGKLTDIDSNLTNRLKGRILLQIENQGQAWYINPKNGKRYYMANGNEAYSIMRELGIGITNIDLEKIKTDTNFAKKHSGKIFLQVEANGEAYYIDFDGNAHYLKNGQTAYDIMRDLGLGITNENLRKIDIN